MGGTAALAVAASQNVSGVVTMSAPLDIGSLNARSGIRAYRGPLLILVGQDDDERYTGAARTIIASSAATPKRLVTVKGSAHGTDLLVDKAEGARVQTVIVDFLESHRG
jgi:esterase/lipase